jgi:outer membrane autotransporter protein
LRIELGPTASSQLTVLGTANLGGALDLIYDPGVLIGKEYVVLGASGVTGRFAVTDGTPPSGYFPVLTYAPNQVDVALEPAVSGAADSIWSSLTSAMIENAQDANAALMAHLAALDAGIGGGTFAGLAPAAPLRLAMNGGSPGLNGALAGLPDALAHAGGWFRATGSFASLGGDTNAPGFDAQGGGFLAGFDRPIGDDYLAGIAAGYTHTNLTQSTGSGGTLDTPRLMVYGSALLGRVTVSGAAGYAYDSVSAMRPNVAPGTGASADFSGQEATAAVQASTHLDFHGVTLTPAGGFNYVHLSQAGFTETGAGAFDAAVSAKDVDSLRPFIGIAAAKSFVTTYGLTLTPEADLTWTHEVLSAARGSVLSVGGGTFSVAGVPVPRDELIVVGGVGARMTDRLALYADYHAVLPTGNLFEQTVSAGLRYKF